MWSWIMAPTTRQQQHRAGSPIPAAGFMAPPKSKLKPSIKKPSVPSKKSSTAARPDAALRTAARDAEMAAKALLGLSKTLKKQARR